VQAAAASRCGAGRRCLSSETRQQLRAARGHEVAWPPSDGHHDGVLSADDVPAEHCAGERTITHDKLPSAAGAKHSGPPMEPLPSCEADGMRPVCCRTDRLTDALRAARRVRESHWGCAVRRGRRAPVEGHSARGGPSLTAGANDQRPYRAAAAWSRGPDAGPASKHRLRSRARPQAIILRPASSAPARGLQRQLHNENGTPCTQHDARS
jgi:hypothetical protein